MNRTDVEKLEAQVFALEEFVEQVMPLIIAASPSRTTIEALLQIWAGRDTSDPDEARQGDLAETVLNALAKAAPPGGT